MKETKPGPVKSLPRYGAVKERQYAGPIPIAGGGANLFFWCIESKNDPRRDPLILWLNGGPGSSSFLGLFMENGPYRLRRNDKKQVEPYDNPFSWNTRATYMIFDQPAGVGLSAITDKSLYAPNEQVQTYQLYHALLSFFALYPQYKDLDFYIFGESFAGHYIPTLAHTILDGNKNGYPHVNLKGVGVGDGWVDPLTLQATYGEYGYAHGLIDLDDKAHVDELYRTCRIAVENTMPVPSAESDKICERVEDYIAKAAGGINVYDVREFGDYTFTEIAEYLNDPEVREALHADPAALPWVDESQIVGDLLETGEQGSTAYLYPRLFDELRVLLYSGIYDMDCNFMGTDAWLKNLSWPFGQEFNALKRTPWSVDGKIVGWARAAKSLTQVLVANAGHLVPMNQPAVALDMLDRFLTNRAF